MLITTQRQARWSPGTVGGTQYRVRLAPSLGGAGTIGGWLARP